MTDLDTPRSEVQRAADDARAIAAAIQADIDRDFDRAELATYRPVPQRSPNGVDVDTVAAPDFPIDILPMPMRVYVAAAAESLRVPAEMIGLPMLALAGAVIGNRAHLQLKASWHEYPTLFVAVVAPPGSAKTPALSLASWPVESLQDDAHETYRRERAAYETDLDDWRVADPVHRGPKPPPPRLRHYYTADVTVEALVGMLVHAPGLAIIRDEIGGWVAAMDQYRGGKGSDRQQYLSLWSGRPIKADRKSGEPVYARHPVACVVGGIQPDLAGELHDAAQRRDGFVERILPLVPDVKVARWSDDAPTSGQYADVRALFLALDRLPMVDAAPAGAVPLSEAACERFIAWHDENAAIVESADGLAAGFYAKLPAHVARFALILHALWQPYDPFAPLPAERMDDAIVLAECCRAHINRFLALLHAAAPEQTAGIQNRIIRIMRIIPAKQHIEWVSRSDLLRGLRNVKPSDLTAALEAMERRGVLERQKVATDTKPAQQWRLVSEELPQNPRSPNGNYSDYSDFLPNEEVRS